MNELPGDIQGGEKCIIKIVINKWLKSKLIKNLRLTCWIVLFLGAYSVNAIIFSNSYRNLIKEEIIDCINKTTCEIAARYSLSLIMIEIFAAGTLIWLKRNDHDTEYYLAIALGLAITASLLVIKFFLLI